MRQKQVQVWQDLGIGKQDRKAVSHSLRLCFRESWTQMVSRSSEGKESGSRRTGQKEREDESEFQGRKNRSLRHKQGSRRERGRKSQDRTMERRRKRNVFLMLEAGKGDACA